MESSPTRAKWPPEITLSDNSRNIVLKLAPRAICVDLAEVPDDPEQLRLEMSPSLVGRLDDGRVSWMRCSLRDAVSDTPHPARTAYLGLADIMSLIDSGKLQVYVLKGNTFRSYTATVETTDTPPAASEAPAVHEIEPTGAPVFRGKRNRDKYSSAVAFEFVNSVMTAVVPGMSGDGLFM